MKYFPPQSTDRVRLRQGSGGFTLIEVLAAMLMMAIIVPVALEGMSVVSRAAVLGQRKAAAMRVAERVLDEELAVIAQGQPIPTSGNGTETDGDTAYPWTMQTENWSQDSMTQMTVRITFIVQGNSYEMTLSTLFDPNAGTAGTATNTGRAAS